MLDLGFSILLLCCLSVLTNTILASVRQRASTRSDSADRVVGLSSGLACGCNHEAHPYNMSCFGTILISYEAEGRNRCEGRGLSILTSFGENWLFDGWNVNEFK